LYDNFLYIHGGLEDEKHNNPARLLNEINLLVCLVRIMMLLIN